ncbi:group II intron reverse transcriptase/maturase [Shouchella shacheensis]|uniref:group II intron reverse transcriptase/maturase n=1 Tax=Shouchella shacheensis TaxID=1649580 RepID=UPI000740094D|nr:group II intron reverse transcriptase/maturase [Shouchella shacheensis]
MNQELKLKWHSFYGQILKYEKLETAWKQVKANKGAPGIDGETIKEYDRHSYKNLHALLEKLKKKEYLPSPARRVYIPKKNGKKRPLGIPTVEDRIVQQAVVNALQPKFEAHIFHKWSCGYRPNRGMERVLQIIMANIEQGYNYIYDCDIKGFFDNIPHKKLDRIVRKYIADGTVLKMIWKWLKAGYMEDGNYLHGDSGTPQGGVISPLLANIYLNELDWILSKANIRFVRYADDFLLFAKTEEDIKKAEMLTHKVIENLGLEISIEKTKVVNFNEEDFDFVGYTFEHWRKRKRDGKPYYIAKPKETVWEDFRQKIKRKTRKTHTKSQDEWVKEVNPVIRGKINHYLNLWKATEANKQFGIPSSCYFNVCYKELLAIDGYIRRRLRVAMIHRNPTQRKGMAMNLRWNIEFFTKIGLVSAFQHYYGKQFGHTIEDYIEYMKNKGKKKLRRAKKRAEEKGEVYYNEYRLRKMKNASTIKTS